jgi:hypothetical protein
MEKDFIPDLTKYSSEELLDLYMNLDKKSNPEYANALEERIKLRLNSVPPARNNFLKFLKKYSGLILIILFLAAYYLMIRQRTFTPGQSPSAGTMMLPLLFHAVVLSILGYYTYKGKILAGLLTILYFLYMMFGSKLF